MKQEKIITENMLQPVIAEISELTPTNEALFEAGKKMLIDSIDNGREFCKSMISTCTGAIPIYLGILAVLLPKDYALGFLPGILVSLPAVIFLISSFIFIMGYLPVVSEEFSLDYPEEINTERNKIIKSRSRFIKIGIILFSAGTLLAI